MWPHGRKVEQTASSGEAGTRTPKLCRKTTRCREEANSDSTLGIFDLLSVAFVIMITQNSLPWRTLLLCLTVNQSAFVQNLVHQ